LLKNMTAGFMVRLDIHRTHGVLKKSFSLLRRKVAQKLQILR
jgi:hypothetical protein